SALHYLRTVRFKRTDDRARYIAGLYSASSSQTVKRACIDCWRQWRDRASFTRERNRWNSLGVEERRMLWLAASEFGDEGEKYRRQVQHSLPQALKLGIERAQRPSFASIYMRWE